LLTHIDNRVGSEFPSQREAMPVVRKARDCDGFGTGVPRGERRENTALAWTEDNDVLAHAQLRDLVNPACDARERIEQRHNVAWNMCWRLFELSVRVQIEVRGVAAP